MTGSASGQDEPAVVLVSGGLDSAVTLAIARETHSVCHCLTFRYGQRHDVELVAARRVAASLGAMSTRTIDIDLRAFGGSVLTDDGLVPKHRDPMHMVADIPPTYVPARNTIFLSFALALAEVTGSRVVYIGANAVDYSGYPDCRPAFLAAFEAMANLATRAGVAARGERERFHVAAPLLAMSKAQIVAAGISRGVDLSLTWSCYDPVRTGSRATPCGACDACVLRAKGFAQAGLVDGGLGGLAIENPGAIE